MITPIVQSIRQEFASEVLGTTISFFRATRGSWNSLTYVIPADIFDPVLRGLNVGYSLGILASLQIPSILKTSYEYATSDLNLMEKGVALLATSGDLGAVVAMSLQSVATIVQVAQPILHFATPLLFVSLTLSSLHIAEHAKTLINSPTNSPEYRIARLKSVAIVLMVIAIGIFVFSNPASTGIVLVGFSLCLAATSLNLRASWIKYQSDLDIFDRAQEKIATLRLEALYPEEDAPRIPAWMELQKWQTLLRQRKFSSLSVLEMENVA